MFFKSKEKIKSTKLAKNFKKHNENKITFNGIKQFILDVFYRVGYGVEIQTLAIIKKIKKYIKSTLKTVLLAIYEVVKFVQKYLDTLLDDMGEPFEKLERARKNVKDIYKEKTFFKAIREIVLYIKQGLSKHKRSGLKMFNYLLPVVTFVIMVVVVQKGLHTDYALDVVLDGDVVGTISTYNELDNANTIIKNKLVSTSDEKWELGASVNIVPKVEKTVLNERELADSILKASDKNIVEAKGLYVNGEFLGAVEDGTLLQSTIDGMLEPYQNGDPNREVSFVTPVSMLDGIFFADTIVSETKLTEKITGEVSGRKVHTISAGDSPSGIAQKNGITLATLYNLNPDLDDMRFWPGDEVLVGASVPFLQVKYVETVTRQLDIPFKTTTSYNNKLAFRTTKVTTAGEKGIKEQQLEVEYIDGILNEEKIISEVILKEPVTEVTEIGTLLSTGQTIQPGSGQFLWPVGSGWRWSRGFAGQYPAHNGIDLAAPTGTPVYAIESGVVTRVTYSTTAYGYCVEIDHGGLQSLYAHNSQILVSPGQVVSQGQMIARIGSTGWSTGPHLHFEIKNGSYRYDPMAYL